MDYPLKRGFKPDLERIKKALEEEFKAEITQDGDKLLLSYGALKSISVGINGKKLNVTTESAIGVKRHSCHGYQQTLQELPGEGHRLHR